MCKVGTKAPRSNLQCNFTQPQYPDLSTHLTISTVCHSTRDAHRNTLHPVHPNLSFPNSRLLSTPLSRTSSPPHFAPLPSAPRSTQTRHPHPLPIRPCLLPRPLFRPAEIGCIP